MDFDFLQDDGHTMPQDENRVEEVDGVDEKMGDGRNLDMERWNRANGLA